MIFPSHSQVVLQMWNSTHANTSASWRYSVFRRQIQGHERLGPHTELLPWSSVIIGVKLIQGPLRWGIVRQVLDVGFPVTRASLMEEGVA